MLLPFAASSHVLPQLRQFSDPTCQLNRLYRTQSNREHYINKIIGIFPPLVRVNLEPGRFVWGKKVSKKIT